MDKESAMQIEACLPQSWWEFSIEHAVHCYNRTSVKRLNWRTPFEAITGKKPDISRMRVFGCGAYVYIPPTRRHNKLSPKSELMVFLGETEGMKGYHFMRSGNIIFHAAQALFDEELYPRCKTQPKHSTTRVDKPRADQPPLNNEDAPAGAPASVVPWDNFGNEMPPSMHPSQTTSPAPPAPAPKPQTPPRQPAQQPVIRGIPPGPRSTMQRGSSMDTPYRHSPEPSRPTLVPGTGVPRHRPQPQARAGPSSRPQVPVLPHRSPQHPPPRRLDRTPSPTEEERELSPTPAPRRSTHLRRPPT